MGEVISLLDNSPHLTGEAVCLNCKHTWTAVTPIGVFKELECPKCSVMKGLLNYGCEPESAWTCRCGSPVMTISGISKKILCYQCGLEQRGFDDE